MVLLPKAVDDPTLSRLSPGKAGSPVSVLAHSFRSPSAPRGAIVYNQVLKGRPTPPRAARPTSSSPRLAHPSPQRQTTTTYIQAASGLGAPPGLANAFAVAYESPTTPSASPRPMAGAYASPERRPASPRHESRPASPRHESPLSSAFHTPRGELAERPLTPRTRVSRLEHENDKLRTTVARLKMNVIYMAGSSDQLDTRAAAVASRSPQLRSKSPRLTDGMSHEQMMCARHTHASLPVRESAHAPRLTLLPTHAVRRDSTRAGTRRRCATSTTSSGSSSGGSSSRRPSPRAARATSWWSCPRSSSPRSSPSSTCPTASCNRSAAAAGRSSRTGRRRAADFGSPAIIGGTHAPPPLLSSPPLPISLPLISSPLLSSCPRRRGGRCRGTCRAGPRRSRARRRLARAARAARWEASASEVVGVDLQVVGRP